MMVFIPFNDPIKIAKILDYKRLGKQRVEARQILSIILGEAKGSAWRHHPAVLMWKDYPRALKYYYNMMIKEWIERGYVNNMKTYDDDDVDVKMPWFMYCEPILLSHRATLLRKNHSHYSEYFEAPKSYIEHGVIWPVSPKYVSEENIEKLKNNISVKLDDICVKLEQV